MPSCSGTSFLRWDIITPAIISPSCSLSLSSHQDNVSSVHDIIESAHPLSKLVVHCDNQILIFQTVSAQSWKFRAQESMITFQWVAFFTRWFLCGYIQLSLRYSNHKNWISVWKELYVIYKVHKLIDITHFALQRCLLESACLPKGFLHKTCPSKLCHFITSALSCFSVAQKLKQLGPNQTKNNQAVADQN